MRFEKKVVSIHIRGKYAPQNSGWVGLVGSGADCIIVPEPTLEWQSDTSVGPELFINTPYK